MKIIFCFLFVFAFYTSGTAIAQTGAVPPASAQNKITGNNLNLKQLSSSLIDEYGLQNLKFMKTKDGRYISLKSEELKKLNEEMYLDTNTIIIILAIIGAIALVLLIFR
jgi:hypothetical protein